MTSLAFAVVGLALTNVTWRLELADGSVVVPTNALAKGYAVTAEFKRAADGAYDYGPFTWKTSDTQEVRTVAWPIVTVPRTDDAAILYSEVWGSPGNLRRPGWEKAAVGKNLNVVRDAPAFRFGALLNGTETSWYLDSRETDLAQVRFFFRKGSAPGTAEIEAQHPLPASVAGGRLVPFAAVGSRRRRSTARGRGNCRGRRLRGRGTAAGSGTSRCGSGIADS